MLSGFHNWEHRKNATEGLIFPENIGARLSLDETCLSQGELYTIVTNKGFLEKSIWNDGLTYGQMGKILQKILGVKTIKADTAERDVKLFNATGSAKLKDFEAKNEDKILNYLKSVCPDTDFPKGRFINDIRKNTGRNG